MASSLSAMQAEATSVLRDSSNNIVTTTDLTRWLNRAKQDIALRTGVMTKTATGTTSGNTLSLPADFLKLRTLRLGTEDNVEVVDDETFWYANDQGAAYSHTIAIVHAGAIEMYPTPDTGTAYSMRYSYNPADMSADADTSGLPDEFDIKLVYFAQAQGKYKLGEAGEGDRYMAMYEDGLPARPSGMDRTRPGPLTIRPDNDSPFLQSSYTSYG